MKDRKPVQTSLLGIANKALSLAAEARFTKSPVRENRTPGSVRGLPGNWQSYRAQLALTLITRREATVDTSTRWKVRRHSVIVSLTFAIGQPFDLVSNIAGKVDQLLK